MTFTVTLTPSQRTFDVTRDEPILVAAIRQGIGLPYGCKDGACGTCKSRLLEGRVIHGAHQSKALSEAEEAAGLILTCCATPQTDCLVEARTVPGAGEFPILKMPGRVLAIQRMAGDVAVLRVQLPANQNFQFHAGQYIEFILRDGSRRSYSMANAPHTQIDKPGIELHVRHLPGGKFTDHVFSAMKEKEILRLEGPFGSFFLREDSTKPMILLASGTGFAPIKAIIEELQFKQSRSKGQPRRATLYWGCRSRADLYLHDWVLKATEALPWLQYIPVLSEPKPEDAWTGRTGLVHLAVMHDPPNLTDYQVYACGAPVMVEAAQHDFVVTSGLPDDELYADAFTSDA
jgi:CDP-4-dehydro-6-deoxyglucose reductase